MTTKTVTHVLPSAEIVAFPTTGRGDRLSTSEKRAQARGKDDGLTKAKIAKLVLPAGKDDATFWDNNPRGLGLRIRAGGKRAWIVQTRVNGKLIKATLGSADALDLDEARTRAKEVLSEASRGADPTATKRKAMAAVRLGDLVDNYLAYAGGHQRASTLAATTRDVKIAGKALHGLVVKEIGRTDVAALHDKLTAKNGPVAANRSLASLSGFFSWAVGKGYIDINPTLSVPKNGEKARDRVLTDAELKAIWHATDSGQGSDFNRIVRLLMLTGSRRTEVGDMQWSELQDDLWTVPGERTKNHRAHEVPLTEFALQNLPAKAPQEGSKFVFGKLEKSGFSGWSKAKARLDKEIGFDNWSLHDLRRTMSTLMHDRLDIEPHVVEAILNHVSGHKGGVGGVYNKAAYRTQKREALQRWADLLAAVFSQ